MARFLVTGGAGFIGSNITESLVARGHEVRVLDNFSTGRRENISSFQNDIALIEGDMRDPDTVRSAVAGMDYILHHAALPSVPRSIADPLACHDANITGTLNLLLSARDAGVKRFVFASSSSVYGDSEVLPKHEKMTPRPLSPYAVSKLTGEYYAQVFRSLFGVPAVSLRYFNVFGPRQDPHSDYAAVIPKFITTMLAGGEPTIFGDGEQSRDFTYVHNVVEANLLACDGESDSVYGVFNVACSSRITIRELVQSINGILKTAITPAYGPSRPGDVKHSFADISRARERLGFVPRVDFNEGLEKTIEWHRKHRAS